MTYLVQEDVKNVCVPSIVDRLNTYNQSSEDVDICMIHLQTHSKHKIPPTVYSMQCPLCIHEHEYWMFVWIFQKLSFCSRLNISKSFPKYSPMSRAGEISQGLRTHLLLLLGNRVQLPASTGHISDCNCSSSGSNSLFGLQGHLHACDKTCMAQSIHTVIK